MEERQLLATLVVFNELMYNTAAADETLEFIEFHNQNAVNVDLTGWSISGGVDYQFPAGTSMPSRGYLLVAANPAALEAAQDLTNVLGPFTGNLSNGGEAVRLIDNNGRQLDRIDYGDSGDWPAEADGTGATLAKVNQDTASNDPTNWSNSLYIGGSPGRENFTIPPTTFETLVGAGDSTRLLIPQQAGDLDSSWEDLGFDDQVVGWSDVNLGIGFDSASESDVASLINANGNVAGQMLGQQSSAFTRTAFQVDDPTAIESLSLDLHYDDGYIAYLNGIEVGRNNAPAGEDIWDASANGQEALSYEQRITDINNDGAGGPIAFFRMNEPVASQHLVNSGSAGSTVRARYHDFNDTGNGLAVSVTGLTNDGNRAVDLGNDGHVLGNGFDSVEGGNPFDGSWTIEGWFDRDTISPFGTIFSNSVAESGPTFGFIDSTNEFGVSIGNDVAANSVTVDLGANHLNQTIYAAVTKSGGNGTSQATFRVIVNLDGTWLPIGVGSNVGWALDAQDGFMIGRNNGAAYALYDGTIDDVAVYDRVLGFDEIESRYGYTGRVASNSLLGIPPSVESHGFESIDLTASLGTLEVGENVLSIQGMNLNSGDTDFLLAPSLQAEIAAPVIEIPEIVINEISGVAADPFWLELKNVGDDPVELANFEIRTNTAAQGSYVLPAATLGSGEFLVINETDLGFRPLDADKLHLFGPSQQFVVDSIKVTNGLRGRSEAHEGRWLYPDAPTVGLANSFSFEQDIVINEVMYHFHPESPTRGTPAEFASDTLIDFTDTWRYSPVGVDLGTVWDNTTHPVDNQTWFSGNAPIGYETAALPIAIQTQLTNPLLITPRIPTYYYETDFILIQDPQTPGFQLRLTHMIDDGAVIHINGEEVTRFNMRDGAVDFGTLAENPLNQASIVGPVSLPIDDLVVGINRISIEVHQITAGSSDTVFAAQLLALTETSPTIPGDPFIESNEEWIEIYNRGNDPVELTGWEIDGGVQYSFDPGTMIQPDEYLVISNDAASLATKYPNIDIVGDFSGGLSNRSDLVQLIDANKNPADEMTYFDSGRWSGLADGGGSSLELLDPNADNSIPEAWAGSDEAGKSQWQTYTYRQVAQNDVGPNAPQNWNEFIFGMLDSGEVLIDDVSVVQDPDGAAVELIQNSTFQLDGIGANPSSWRIIGNHSGSVAVDPDNPANRAMLLSSVGATEHMHNHAETTFTGNTPVVNGVEYEISYRAKWLNGSSLLNNRSYLVRFAATIPLEVPDNNGTPGAVNSTAVSNLGPTYTELQHSPVIPEAGQAVTVSIKAQDTEGINSVAVQWGIDGGGFSSSPMVLDLDGFYRALIPSQSAGTVVQFYVAGIDSLGALSTFPAAGPDSRALIRFNDGVKLPQTMHNVQIIMTSADTADLFEPTQLMSNRYRGATVVYNGSEVFYDVGARPKGSPVGRNVASRRGSYNVKFDPTHLFKDGLARISLDGSGQSGLLSDAQDEILAKHLDSASGDIVGRYDDLAFMIGPRSDHNSTVILQQTGYDSDDFLDTRYADDNGEGIFFEHEVIHFNQTTVDGDPESLKISSPPAGGPPNDFGDKGTDKEDYRWILMLENNRARDDFSSMIAVSQAFDAPVNEFADRIDEVIDVDQWLRMFAANNLIGNYDIYGTGPMHNVMFYAPPNGGKVQALPWDQDGAFTFFSGTLAFPIYDPQNINTKLNQLIEVPHFQRLYEGHMLDMIENTYNSDYFTEWALNYSYIAGQDFSTHINYVDFRGDLVLTALAPQVPFAITTNSGVNFSVTSEATDLQGAGWIDVDEIRVAGTLNPLDVTWLDEDTWEINIPLGPGSNVIDLEAFNRRGDAVGTDSITIFNNLNNVTQQEALRISEVNYNPSDPAPASLFNNDDYEFIEVTNIAASPVQLEGAAFVDGVTFTFGNLSLNPNEYTVVVRNQAAFEDRYGTNIPIAGVFTGGLSNSGETVELVDGLGATIDLFTYSDGGNWPGRADGNASSLEPIDLDGNLNDPDNWRSSRDYEGSPGAAGYGDFQDVIINEVLSHTDLPAVDSIEIYNTSPDQVDISGWWISDSNNNYFKFQVPDLTFIDGFSYMVFDETQFNISVGVDPNDFGLSGSRGEDVYLMATDAGGSPDRFADSVDFMAQANGESWGRWPNAVGDLYPMISTTLGDANSGPRVGPLVITELMYNAPDPDGVGGIDPTNLEYIEIVNPTGLTVNLTSWEIDRGADYAFLPNETIDPGEVIVVVGFDPSDLANATLVDDFRNYYGIDNTVRLLGGFNNRLDNTGERIQLIRPDSPPLDEPDFIPLLLEDEVRYSSTAPWPTEPNGNGESLTRAGIALWGNDPASWTAELPSPGSVELGVPVVLGVALNSDQVDPVDLPKGDQPTNWADQRSEIASIVVTFNQPVNVTVADIVLTNLGVDAPNDADQVITLSAGHVSVAGSVLTLSFAEYELPEGVYQIEILPSVTNGGGIGLDGNGDGNSGDSYILRGSAINEFYRLTAEWNGDGGVSVFDFTTFSYWFGSSVLAGDAPAYADLNVDGGVSVFDFSDFSSNFGIGIVYPVAFAQPQANVEPSLQREEVGEQESAVDIALDELLREWTFVV
jgi:hypothetical protein